MRVVEAFPAAGTQYHEARLPDTYWIYLEKIDCHLYYTFDDDDVVIRALWGARKRRGPRVAR